MQKKQKKARNKSEREQRLKSGGVVDEKEKDDTDVFEEADPSPSPPSAISKRSKKKQ